MGLTAGDRLRHLWVTTVASARYDRLEGSLRVAEIEIARRTRDASPGGCWAEAARDLLSGAREALTKGRLDQGWKLLHAARRMEIFVLDATALESRAAVLRTEADKLKSWRQKAVERLLGSADKPLANITAGAVYDASVTRDEHYDNQAYKDGLVRTHMLTLGVSLAAVLVLVVGVLAPPGAGPGANLSVVGAVRTGQLAGNAPVSPPGNASVVGAVRGGPPAGASVPGAPDVSPFGAIVLFGLLGGTVSAMIRAAEPGQSSRIPELTAAMRVTFLRVVMGGASALVLYVVLRSGIGSALGTQVFSKDIADAMKDLGGYTVYTVAFVAGFSERLVTRAVDKIVGSADDKGKVKAGG